MPIQDLPIGGVVFRDLEAKDADAGINALVEYKVVPETRRGLATTTKTSLFEDPEDVDGFGVFEFSNAQSPVLTLRQPVDYESVRRYVVTIVASVKYSNSIYSSFRLSDICREQDRAFNTKDRLSSTTTLTVNVGDVEDNPPAFQYVGCPLNNRGVCITPTYTATV